MPHNGSSQLDNYVWPRINSDVCKWARSCLPCQHSKVQRHAITPLSTFATRGSKVISGIIARARKEGEPGNEATLPPSCGYSYLLTCINRFIRWPEAISIADILAETVAKDFVTVSGWIGVSSTATPDCGRQFESAHWMELMHLLGPLDGAHASVRIQNESVQLHTTLSLTA